MTSLVGNEQLVHQVEGMSEQQKKLIKMIPLLGGTEQLAGSSWE
jgi:hypothetical protein